MRIAALCAFLSTATLAAGPTFEVEGRSPLCQAVAFNLNKSKDINQAVHLSGFKVVPFQRTNLAFRAFGDGPPTSEQVEVATFDIDNDGRPNIVVRYETWHHNYPGDLLWIFPQSVSVNTDALPSLTSEDFGRLSAVEPMSPWPYADRGIWFARIAALTLQGTTYLSLRDTMFGDKKFPDRRWMIAKYSGQGVPSRGFHDRTDNLETICAFRYARK